MKPHRGTLILVLGILSLVVCQLIGPFAWIMGNKDLKEINEGRMDPEGKGLTNAGRICGMIGTILFLVVLVLYCFIFIVIGGISMMGTPAKTTFEKVGNKINNQMVAPLEYVR